MTSCEDGDSMVFRQAPLEKFQALTEPPSEPVKRRRWW